MSLDREPTRTVTGESTIPAGVAGSGAVTTHGSSNLMLRVIGGAIADFEKFTDTGYRNIWIYCVEEHKVAKVKGIMRVSDTEYIVYVDRAMASITANTFTIVTGDLIEWGAQNTGAAAGEVDGASLPAGSADNRVAIHVPGNGYPIERDVVTVDGTGTSIKIYEVR